MQPTSTLANYPLSVRPRFPWRESGLIYWILCETISAASIEVYRVCGRRGNYDEAGLDARAGDRLAGTGGRDR